MTLIEQLQTGIRRLRRGADRFRYQHADGSKFSPEGIERILSLAIPPAWKDVAISPTPRAKLQCLGRDARGRWQYRYHAQFRRQRDRKKFERLLGFAQALPKMRRRVEQDLALPGMPRQKVLACVLRILATSFIRPGSRLYAQENGGYGLATLRNKHVQVHGDWVEFEGFISRRRRSFACFRPPGPRCARRRLRWFQRQRRPPKSCATAQGLYPLAMDKHALLDQLFSRLRATAQGAERARAAYAQEAREGATPAERRDDARVALENAGLAVSQSKRADRARADLSALDGFRPAPFSAEAPIGLGAIVEVEDEEGGRTFFLAPAGAGEELSGPDGDGFLSVVTPSSPVGQAVLGRKAGECVAVTVKGELRDWTITYVG